MNCPYCRSENIENTNITMYSYPSYTVYTCLDCSRDFRICNDEQIPEYDLTESKDVTNSMIYEFFDNILQTGHISNHLTYNGQDYYHFRTFDNRYYYKIEEDNIFKISSLFIHLYVEKQLIREAVVLYEQLRSFYLNLKDYKVKDK